MVCDTDPMKTDLKQLRFFEALSVHEQARLREAVAGYCAVMDNNLEARWASQSEEAREEAARPLSWKTMSEDAQAAWALDYASNPRATWDQTQRMLSSISSGGLVGGKSALLARLIEGKPALRERPPCSFSYPWYEIVEATGSTMVTTLGLSGVMSLGSLMNGSGGAESSVGPIEGVASLVINQSSYRLVEANVAGRALLRLVVAMLDSPDGEREVDDWRFGGAVKRNIPALTRRHRLWDEVLAAYASGPEFRVQHGHWPAWRLFVGARVGVVDREWAMDGIRKGAFAQLADVNPMDLTFAGLNAKVVQEEVIGREAASEVCDEAAQRIQNVLRGQAPDYTASLAAWPTTLAPSGSGEGKPAVVRLATSCWMLEKSPEWVGFDPFGTGRGQLAERVLVDCETVGNVE